MVSQLVLQFSARQSCDSEIQQLYHQFEGNLSFLDVLGFSDFTILASLLSSILSTWSIHSSRFCLIHLTISQRTHVSLTGSCVYVLSQQCNSAFLFQFFFLFLVAAVSALVSIVSICHYWSYRLFKKSHFTTCTHVLESSYYCSHTSPDDLT